MIGVDGKADANFYRWPSDAQVAELWRTHGLEAVTERWWFLTPRTLYSMRRRHLDRMEQRAA